MLKIEKELLLEQMKMNGSCKVKVGGYCMRPVINNNSIVDVKPEMNFKIGDIIAYFIKDQMYVHRIANFFESGYVVKADNKKVEEHYIGIKDILGKVVKIKNQSFINKIIGKLVWNKKS